MAGKEFRADLAQSVILQYTSCSMFSTIPTEPRCTTVERGGTSIHGSIEHSTIVAMYRKLVQKGGTMVVALIKGTAYDAL